jgi:hypothetical protein
VYSVASTISHTYAIFCVLTIVRKARRLKKQFNSTRGEAGCMAKQFFPQPGAISESPMSYPMLLWLRNSTSWCRNSFPTKDFLISVDCARLLIRHEPISLSCKGLFISFSRLSNPSRTRMDPYFDAYCIVIGMNRQ